MAAKEFGEKLKELRSKKHTQAQLGDILGVGEKQIQRYEAGDLLPDHEKVKKLITLYHYDFVSLIYDIPRELSAKGTDLQVDYKTKYIALLEKENDQKAQIIETNLTGLLVQNKSILAHLAVGMEYDALREAGGDKRKAQRIKDNMDKRIGEVLVGESKENNDPDGDIYGRRSKTAGK